jgi:DnaJ-class molecular chaperone
MNFLNGTDKIEVITRCGSCGGQKGVSATDGGTSPCPTCEGTGEVVRRVMLRELVDFVGESMAKEIRLRTGKR